jgi:hypothetical protein
LSLCRADTNDGCVIEERDDARVGDGGDDTDRVFDHRSNARLALDARTLVTRDRKDAEH